MKHYISTHILNIKYILLILSSFSVMLSSSIYLLIILEIIDINQSIIQNLSNQMYNTIITSHALLVIFYLIVAALFGAFGNILFTILISSYIKLKDSKYFKNFMGNKIAGFTDTNGSFDIDILKNVPYYNVFQLSFSLIISNNPINLKLFQNIILFIGVGKIVYNDNNIKLIVTLLKDCLVIKEFFIKYPLIILSKDFYLWCMILDILLLRIKVKNSFLSSHFLLYDNMMKILPIKAHLSKGLDKIDFSYLRYIPSYDISNISILSNNIFNLYYIIGFLSGNSLFSLLYKFNFLLILINIINIFNILFILYIFSLFLSSLTWATSYLFLNKLILYYSNISGYFFLLLEGETGNIFLIILFIYYFYYNILYLKNSLIWFNQIKFISILIRHNNLNKSTKKSNFIPNINSSNSKLTFGSLVIYVKKPSDLIIFNNIKNIHMLRSPEAIEEFFLLSILYSYNINNFILTNPLLNRHLIYNLKNKAGIYLWYNRINGKIYIGSSINLYERIRRYYKLSNKDIQVITKAFVKYGFNNFLLIILEDLGKTLNIDNKLLLSREQHYMDKYLPEYNIAKFAGNTKGVKASAETKLLISEALKGNKYALNMIHTEKTKALMRP